MNSAFGWLLGIGHSAKHRGVQLYVRLRVILPLVTGTVSVPLVIWDVHNQSVISSMGMAWDTGAPLWPYETPHFLLYFLNYPAHFITRPVANFLELVTLQYDLFIFPIALLWWWLLGLTLDGAFRRFDSRWRWPTITILIAAVGVLSWTAEFTFVDAFRWWFEYGADVWRAQTLVMLIALAPTVWSTFLALIIAIVGKRALVQWFPRNP